MIELLWAAREKVMEWNIRDKEFSMMRWAVSEEAVYDIRLIIVFYFELQLRNN